MSSTPIKSNKKWQPKASLEAKRLSFGKQSESNWQLASAEDNLPQTRHQRKKETDEESKQDDSVTAEHSNELTVVNDVDDMSSITDERLVASARDGI